MAALDILEMQLRCMHVLSDKGPFMEKHSLMAYPCQVYLLHSELCSMLQQWHTQERQLQPSCMKNVKRLVVKPQSLGPPASHIEHLKRSP